MQTTYWVAQEIVSEPDLLGRARVFQKFIEIAAALQSKELFNMHGFVAIMTGLTISHVRVCDVCCKTPGE